MGKRIIRITVLILSILMLLSGAYLVYQILAPEIEYRVVKPNEKEIQQTIENIQTETKLEQNRLYIPSIGVDMEIGGSKEFLDFGGWVQEVNYEGMPELIAIHRFGFNGLSPEQKLKQTLYHVNKLDEGDVVYLVWDGVLYEYAVKEVFSGVNNPSRKDGIMIYTCKFVSSKERVFVVLQILNIIN